MPLDEVLPIARQIAEAIEYVHERVACAATSNRTDHTRHEPP
jgi:hypothetical protein